MIKNFTRNQLKEKKDFFNKNGFVIFENVLNKNELNKVRKKYKKIFKGHYETGVVPDKIKWVYGRDKNNIPRSVCNAWKSDYDVARVVLSKKIGQLVASLQNWNSTRLNQDSLIWVVPGAGSVAFHQDNPYQDWHTPGKVITAWIPLENTSKEGATLEYLVGSHKNGTTKRLNKFFTNQSYRSISKKLLSNADKFGRHYVIAKKGSIVFHHGDMWHGSGFNKTKQDRITLSIHFMNGNSKFHDRIKNPHFNHYKILNSSKMDETFYPVTWHKSKKVYFKDKYLRRN